MEVTSMSGRPKPFIRMIIACLFFLIAVTLNILLPRYWHNTPEIVKHLLLVFSAIMCVHIMEYAYLWWEIFGHIRHILEDTLQATHKLIDLNRNSLENFLQTTNQLIGSATSCGLTNIYCSRKDVKSDIYDVIENAEKRAWLLGITLSENVHLDQLLPTLDEKIARGLDVKILLLDALRGAAIFRTLLECNASDVENIINVDRTKMQPNDPFFHQRLYSDFIHACDRLRGYPSLRPAVRFYTHTPTCWMMVIDDMAYFQPYTMGRTQKNVPKQCTGVTMPVLKFQMQSKGKPFENIEDHFSKIWLTSNVDLFHVEAQINDHSRIINDIFNSNEAWLKHIYGTLYVSKGSEKPFSFDRRKFPRQPWIWNDPTLTIRLESDATVSVDATFCNYSREGISLKLKTQLNLSEGQIVMIQGMPPTDSCAASFVLDHFLKIGRFKVKWMRNGTQQSIGLQALPEDKILTE